MIHPSYADLMNAVNSGTEAGEEPVVNSRYSIVLATAKRARQLINGAEPLVDPPCNKALSIAVAELNEGKVKILTGNEDEETIEDVTEGLSDEDIFSDSLEGNLDAGEITYEEEDAENGDAENSVSDENE